MKAPPRKAWQVHSWWRDAWWVVDQRDTETDALDSAAARQVFVTTPLNGPALILRHGKITLNEDGRFAVAPKGQRP